MNFGKTDGYHLGLRRRCRCPLSVPWRTSASGGGRHWRRCHCTLRRDPPRSRGPDGARFANSTTQRTEGGATVKQLIVGSIVLVLVLFGWSDRSLGEEAREPRGELRIVDKSPVNWASITYNVFEHLIT